MTYHTTRNRCGSVVGMAFMVASLMLPSMHLAIHSAEPEAASTPWPQRRPQVESAWLDLLGDFPSEIPDLRPTIRKVTLEPGCPSERLTAQQLEVLRQQIAEEDGSLIRYHVSFSSEQDDRVTAWLLVPVAALEQPTPAMICIHSTTRGSGKDATIGLSGRTPIELPDTSEGGRSYGLHLARHGYVTLSIDLLTDGERIEPNAKAMDSRPFYKRHPQWSIVGKNTWDIMRSVDFLQTLDYVDAKHIGCIGLSLGGHTTVFAAAFEPRITAAISIGGVLDWHRPGEHWSRGKGTYIYIKKFRPYIDDAELPIPVDFDELMMMVAPRPLLIVSSEWEFYNRRNLLDKCMSVAKVYVDWRDTEGLPSVLQARQSRKSYEKTLSYYDQRSDISPQQMEKQLELLGAGDCFGWFTYPGGHSFPPVVRQYSFAWLDRWLDRDDRWHGQYTRP